VAFPVLAVSYLVAEVLLASAGYKAFRPRGYWQAVGSYQLLRGLPRRLRLLLAGAVPAGELASAALIVVPGTRSVGLGAACAAFMTTVVPLPSAKRLVTAHKPRSRCWSQGNFGLRNSVSGTAERQSCAGTISGRFVSSPVITARGET
jgi:hypothetical protein